MNRHLITITAAMALATASATAQELNSEITVTHDVVPEERAATRLRTLPVVTLPQLTGGRLSPATAPGMAALSPSAFTLEPAPLLTTLLRSPWRGYASLNYGPAYLLDASAGYRFIERRTLTLDGALQFNGMSYSSTHPDSDYRGYGKARLRRNCADLALRTAWQPLAGAQLTAEATYGFAAYNFPLPKLAHGGIPYSAPELCLTDHTDLTVNALTLKAGWHHRASDAVTYSVGAGYSLQANSGVPAAVSQNAGHMDAAVTWHASAASHWSLQADAHLYTLTAAHTSGTAHKGLIGLRPAYTLTTEHFTARLGVRLDILTGNFNPTDLGRAQFYPDVHLTWQPAAIFAITASATGHTDANSLSALYEAQPYIFPSVENMAGFSRVNTYDLGITLGPWRGASLTLYGGLAQASHWLTPAYRAGYWQERSVRGTHFGLLATYSWRSYLTLKAQLEMDPSKANDFSRGYFAWRDHAKADINVSATVRPIKPLAIELAYHLRARRAKPIPPLDGSLADRCQNLGNISDLNLALSYQITDRWSASVRSENLLNHRYYLGPAIPSQGFRAMVGATYKF